LKNCIFLVVFTLNKYMFKILTFDVQMYDSTVSSADETSKNFSDETTLHNLKIKINFYNYIHNKRI